MGKLSVRGRTVTTPALMPVVNPNLLSIPGAVTPAEMKRDMGFEMIITNSYIIRKGQKLRDAALGSGLHGLLDFDGVIMTDSGTFQSYVYGSGDRSEVEVDPIEIVEFQRDIGSDIGTILDRFTPPDVGYEDAVAYLNTTMERAGASVPHKGEMELAIPVQGGVHMDLRTRSGAAVRELGAAYAPIGGVVPLLESYSYTRLVDVIVAAKKGLGPAIPAHLFGAGHPMILPLAVALGCDLFDSASYAKFASDGRYMTTSRTLHLEEMEELPCSCPVCSRTDAKDLRSMPASPRTSALSRHNLWVLGSIMASIREAIREGTLWELVEGSAAANPHMNAAVRRLCAHAQHIEREAPRSTRRFMCVTDHSLCRPEFSRVGKDLDERIPPEFKAYTHFISEPGASHRPFVENAARAVHVKGGAVAVITPMGAIPYAVWEMYPFSQMVISDVDSLPPGMRAMYDSAMTSMGSDATDLEHAYSEGIPDRDPFDRLKVALMVRMQFGLYGGRGADEILLGDRDRSIELVRSRKTGKLRNVNLKEAGGDHILSLRAQDGLFSLKWKGAQILHAATGGIFRRVVVEDGTGDFNANGYNVFNKFVLDADPLLRAGDEVMVVDGEDRLYAVGKAVVGASTMIDARAGMAVKVREGGHKASPDDAS